MKDVIFRTLKTFVAAAGACLLATLSNGINFQDNAAISGLIIACLSAGITAVWNTGLTAVKNSTTPLEEPSDEEVAE